MSLFVRRKQEIEWGQPTCSQGINEKPMQEYCRNLQI
jgi:hypothetical protein